MTNRSNAPAPEPSPGERGFTLVELMVVVAIIALLAAIIIPNYVHARAQAGVSQSEANMKQISTALELYYADKQDYPPTSGTVGPTLFGGANNPYLTSTPTNAHGGQHYYRYTYTGATANGAPATYSISDPDVYDASTLTSVPQAPGNTGNCTGCTKLVLTPQAGIYGTN